LPPSKDAVENLKNEGHIDDKIFLVGNVMIDSLHIFQPKIQESNILDTLGIEKDKYVTVTLHRPSNTDNKETFERILNALNEIQKEIKIIFPIHPRSKKMISEFGFNEKVSAMKNVILTEPLGYLDFGKLISNSKFVLTDSGGIQEETTIYGIPCITLRENTERPITIWEGTNELAGTDTEKILSYAKSILNGTWKQGKIPELWDGKTAERIVKKILELRIGN